MDTRERQRLFTEMMTAVELHDTESDTPVSVSLTGLSDRALREAVIAESCRHDDEWQQNLCIGILKAFMEGVMDSEEKKATHDQLAGVGIAIYICWLNGQPLGLIKTMALLGACLDEIDPDDNPIAFVMRIFAPPPMAVCMKNAYLSLDSLKIITDNTNVYDYLINYTSDLTMSQVKEMMNKEGYSMENFKVAKPKFVDDMFQE